MALPASTLVILTLCLVATAAQKHGKRRPFPLQGKAQLFIPPVALPQRPTPTPQATQVEIQQAEVRSSEFLPPAHELQGPPPPQQQFQPQPQLRQSSRSGSPQPRAFVTPIPIISLNKQQSLDGSYKTSYETANSIQAEETGFLKNLGVPEQEALVQYGSYSYTDPDGRLISVTYTADEGGFRATGDHLPTPPPVPPEVQKGLDIIYESIRLEAERQAKEKSLKNQKLESQNYPVDNQENGRRH